MDGIGEGAISEDAQILAAYCHGLFDRTEALAALLAWAGHKPIADFNPDERRENDIDRLADAVERHLKLELLAERLPALKGM
ncbi:MAG: hypothetical protein LBI87_07210 [Candidatus Accumulibacter sp.]|nr:hypothetical protein [Accumulibacter sp.]